MGNFELLAVTAGVSVLAVGSLAGLTGCSGGSETPTAEPAPAPPPSEAPAPATDAEPHTIVFIVLDTVRAQNLSLCGYDRPTTPTLQSLADDGMGFTCRAYTPASWTMPSHASYFTGLDVPGHGVLRIGVPLRKDVPTLAERLRKRGYRTRFVSGNPILIPKSGIQRGFEKGFARKPKTKGDAARLWGDELPKAVNKVVDMVPADEKLFLFVNIFDAHDPYPEVPAGLDWVDAQPELEIMVKGTMHDGLPRYNKFVQGEMTEAEAVAFTDQIRAGYDYGIYVSDQSISRILDKLREVGRLDRGYRMVITSDHGEFLGEHGILRHGGHVYEEMTRVPLMFRDTTKPGVKLEGPVSAIQAYHLALNGALSAEPVAPMAHAGNVGKMMGAPSPEAVALWHDGKDKLVWKGGESLLYDLDADPAEDAPTPLEAHVSTGKLTEAVETFQTFLGKSGDEADADLAGMLEELGYVDGED